MASERILVVDDEPAVMHSCERILKRNNFIVTGITDSTAVPNVLRQETFDLLLTDIKMPRIDGLELLKIAKEIDPHITVVLITGYGTMEDAIRAIRLGAQDFLMKPFEPKELVQTIETSLAKRNLLRDSLRLQTLLPLLEINKMLQITGGEVSLVQRVLETACTQLGAARLAWLNAHSEAEVAVVPAEAPASTLPPAALAAVTESGQPVWVLGNGELISDAAGKVNIVGAALPLLIKGQLAGILTAEAGSAPFGQISLDLLTVMAGQLAIIIENSQLFQQAETLRAFNEDIIKNMTNGLIAIDRAGVITAFNPAAAAMLGCPIEQALNRPLAQAIPAAEQLAGVFNATLATGQAVPRTEILAANRNGHSLSISISTALLGQENGQTVGAVGVIEDLSEIKALEAEHRRLDRLAALGEMSAVVAHEIRNPVAGIAAGVDYLTRNALPGTAEAQGAVMIQNEVKRVNRILEDILFVARPLQLNKTAQPLPPIVRMVQHRCQPQIEACGAALVIDIDEELPNLWVDNERLEQVLTNLVINATQALPQRGTITISAAVDAARPVIIINVADTGPGIDPDIQSRIFDPFYTTKTKGTGLGLSVARRIIEEHGGDITVASEAGRGTCFTLSLPVGEQKQL